MNSTDINATAFGETNALQAPTVVKNIRKNTAKTTLSLTLGAWNVRTTTDSDSSNRPERATAIICRQLEKGGIDICALSEVRRPGTGNIIEKSHTIFWSGSDKKEDGVAFAINNILLAQCGLNPISNNDRIISLHIELKDITHLTLISAYGPTMQRIQGKNSSSMKSLESVWSNQEITILSFLEILMPVLEKIVHHGH